jgi:hypothetical protein
MVNFLADSKVDVIRRGGSRLWLRLLCVVVGFGRPWR